MDGCGGGGLWVEKKISEGGLESQGLGVERGRGRREVAGVERGLDIVAATT